jgi:hypothetical protein
VRLRRTIAVTVLLALGLSGVVTFKVLGRDDVAGAVDALPGVDATAKTAGAGQTPSVSPTTTPNPQDGSSGTESARPEPTTVPQRGNGKIAVVAVPSVKPAASGRTVRYTVEVEGGLGVDTAEVAATVQSVLLDSRGWQKVDGVRFVNVTPAQAKAGDHVDIRVTLASPGLTDELCAPMRTLSQVSCWNGERSVLNFRRWALGDDSYGDDIARYRIYQINHEVGHGLGHQHRSCPGKGKRAPIMVQQTLSLGGCAPWPFPSGA